MSLGQPRHSDRTILGSSSVARNITYRERDVIAPRRDPEVVLEDDTFVGPVHFLEGSDTNYFHCIYRADFRVPLRKTQLHFIGSTVCITIPYKTEHSIGNRNAGKHHGGIGASRSEIRDLPDIGERVAGCYQPHLVINGAGILSLVDPPCNRRYRDRPGDRAGWPSMGA